MIIRTLQVPKIVGVNKSCNNTAEIIAIAIANMSIPFDRENIILTDSEVAIDLFDKTFNDHDITNRQFIREVGHGVGQSLLLI